MSSPLRSGEERNSMTTLVIAIFTLFYGFSVGVELQSVEAEALEYECSRVEIFKEDLDSRLGRCIYFPVWIYAKVADHFERRERASE